MVNVLWAYGKYRNVCVLLLGRHEVIIYKSWLSCIAVPSCHNLHEQDNRPAFIHHCLPELGRHGCQDFHNSAGDRRSHPTSHVLIQLHNELHHPHTVCDILECASVSEGQTKENILGLSCVRMNTSRILVLYIGRPVHGDVTELCMWLLAGALINFQFF